MEVIPIEAGPLATIGYLVIDDETRKAAAIDVPLASTNTYINLIKEKNAELTVILLTHTHWDHTGETSELKQITNAQILCHKDDEYRLIDPMKYSIYKLPFELKGEKADKYIENKDIIKIGNIELEVLHTPGHTEGGVCFVNHSEKVVFAGDTLFSGSIGRTDFPGGDFDTIINSIKNQLFTLGDDYVVYSGHGEATTIGNEKLFNPFLLDDEFVIA
jgi:glyoxylase-like metal-dependent hydrolase (beta-lactamase superfamily II)